MDFAGHGDQDRNRRLRRIEIDGAGFPAAGRQEVERPDLFFRVRIFPAGDIGADLVADRVGSQQAGLGGGELSAVPPVADIDSRNQHVVGGGSIRVAETVAPRFRPAPDRGMQEEKAREFRVDRNVPHRFREVRALDAGQHDAACSSVFGRINYVEQHACRFLPSERHVAEVIDALIGPAALAVAVLLIAEAAVREA